MERKWVYESIAEAVPPFSWLPRKYNILAQLLAMEIAGIILWHIFNLPTRTLLYGTISIFVVAVWSFLILQLAPTIRDLEHSLRGAEKEFLNSYRRYIFSPEHYELMLGLLIFLIVAAYLLSSRVLLDYLFGENLSLFLLLFVFIFTFDVSYRMGVIAWVSFLAAWRSMNLRRIIKRGTLLEYIPYVDFWVLQRLDSYNLLFVVVSLPMLAAIWQDKFFSLAFIAGACGTVGMNLFSIAMLRRIPWLPHYVYDIAASGRFAYLGTSDGRNQHITPVSFIFDGLRMFVMTSKTTKKVRNIKHNNKISFLVDIRDPENTANNRAVLFIGSARIYDLLDVPTKFGVMLKAWRMFRRKYPEYTKMYELEKAKLPQAWRLTPFISRVLIEIKPKKIVYWKENELPALPMPSKITGGRASQIPSSMHDVLARSRIGYICTVGSNAQPHVAPLFYAYDPPEIRFVTEENSRKVKNIKGNPRVSFAVDVRDPVNPFRNEGVMVSGVASVQTAEKAVVQVAIQMEEMIRWKGPEFKRYKY